MKVQIELPEAQYDFLKKNLARERWLGSLEEFIAAATIHKQEDLLLSGVFKTVDP